MEEGTLSLSLKGDKYDFSSVAFSPDGKLLASGATDGTIWIWHIKDEKLYSRWEQVNPKPSSHRDEWHSLTFSADSTLLVSYWGYQRISVVRQFK